MYSEVTKEVTEIAQQVIQEYLPALAECRIGFVFRETAKKSGQTVVWGQVGKVTERFLPFLKEELDMVIELAEDVWMTELRGDQKKALIHHELLHIIPNKKGDGWATRGHDIEEFIDTLKIYGLWRSNLLLAGSAMKEATAQLPLPFADKPAGKVVAIRLPNIQIPDEILEIDDD